MQTDMDRRSALRTVALSVSAAVGGAPAFIASSAHAAAPRAADWNALERGLDGRLIRPGDAAYESARTLFNPDFDRIRPDGVAYCANPGDVAECLAFARRHGVPIASRSGGHSYAGWSAGPGLVIDVSAMNGVSYAGGRARVGAGARLIDVYDRLIAKGVSIPAGTCPTVGVAGLTLGGGIGVVSRKYGLTCDVLESVRIVTADGRLRTCDANHDPDLFWASRGGGGGNFGVAVSFDFRAHRTRDVTVFFLSWRMGMAAKAIQAWQGWASGAPDELWSSLQLAQEPTANLRLVGVYLGARAECLRLLQGLTDRIGDPSTESVRVVSYRQAMMIMGGVAGRTIAECHRPGNLPGQNPKGKIGRDRFSAKSHLAYRPLSADGARALAAQVTARGNHAVLLDALRGAVGRVRPDATAFPHRAALFSVQYIAHGTGRGQWLRAAHAAMRPHFGDHAYVNYLDPELRDWRSAYYGANAARLARVKAAYDPSRLFRQPQGV
ncbi:FAD-binding oxidoreductase [Thermopolyspora sp. NPDC052614]|uniref:FAD-binding oxidoreductase n=1 Tax=Thermopolyspora sp. NPDC052614 TaxID=3155682 RepID=UPI0034391B0B